jgi:hypothetical protein
MRRFELFIFQFCILVCISLLIYGAVIIKDSNWAMVAITGILVIITAYYASTTDKMLKVNQKTLDLLIIQRKLAKIEEITRIVFIPLNDKIKDVKRSIKNKTNVIQLDLTNKNLLILSITGYNQISKTHDFISSNFESINIDINYDDPIFQKHIKLVFEYIEEYEKEQKEYELFLNTMVVPIFEKIIFPWIEEHPIPQHFYNERLFKSIFDGKLDSSIEKELTPNNSAFQFLNEFPNFIKILYQNNVEFCSIMEKKLEFEERLTKKLDSLSSELNLLMLEWTNEYHIVVGSIPKYLY